MIYFILFCLKTGLANDREAERIVENFQIAHFYLMRDAGLQTFSYEREMTNTTTRIHSGSIRMLLGFSERIGSQSSIFPQIKKRVYSVLKNFAAAAPAAHRGDKCWIY